jgi:hypothetical protein
MYINNGWKIALIRYKDIMHHLNGQEEANLNHYLCNLSQHFFYKIVNFDKNKQLATDWLSFW